MTKDKNIWKNTKLYTICSLLQITDMKQHVLHLLISFALKVILV